MTKVETAGIVTTLLVAAVGTLITFASTGFFATKVEPLEKRLAAVELDSAKKSGLYDEILRRLERIEHKLDEFKR